MPKEDKDSKESAGELASNFVATLGLLDVVLGSIGLYSARLVCGPSVAAAFPSSGFPVADVALLASFAALAGKMLTLLVAIAMASANIAVTRRDYLKYSSRLEAALKDHCAKTGRPVPDLDIGLLDLAFAYLSNDFPKAASSLERIRTQAILAYGAALLTIPYGVYFHSAVGQFWTIPTAFVIFVFFGVFGFAQQLDYFKTATASLTSAARRAGEKAQGGG